MRYLCNFCRISMGFLCGSMVRYVQGMSMVFLWDLYATPMGFLWGCLCGSYDMSMGLIMGFLWDSYGVSLCFL